jgi:flavin reductase (DIM6/NTAB) family NADH-FMN oxidoreductase RutF
MQGDIHILNLGTHAFVIGEVKGTYISDDCLTNGKPDVTKIRPIIFNLETAEYSAIGDVVARAWNVGKELKTSE